MTKRGVATKDSKRQKAFEDRMTYKVGDLIIEFDPKAAKAEQKLAEDGTRHPKQK